MPTYNVFYEARTFSRGGPGLALNAGGVPLGDYRFSFILPLRAEMFKKVPTLLAEISPTD